MIFVAHGALVNVCVWVFACVCVCVYASWQPYLHPPWVQSHFRLDASKITAPLSLHGFTHSLVASSEHRSTLIKAGPGLSISSWEINEELHQKHIHTHAQTNNNDICLQFVRHAHYPKDKNAKYVLNKKHPNTLQWIYILHDCLQLQIHTKINFIESFQRHRENNNIKYLIMLI